MGTRRHSYSRRKKALLYKKITLTLLAILLVGIAAIPAVAWLTASSEVRNEFEIGEGDVKVEETLNQNNNTKENVRIKNEGNVPAYIRASVHIYWKDADGNIMADKPSPNADYDIDWFEDNSGWEQGADGFYYYTKPVRAGDATPNLIDSVTDQEKKDNYKDGRVFYVDIAAQSIQADPATVVAEAWSANGGSVTGVNDGGTLQIQPASGAAGASTTASAAAKTGGEA